MISSIKQSDSVLKVITILVAVLVIILGVLSTFLVDIQFFIQEFLGVDFSLNAQNLILGEIGAFYFFVLPGLPFLVITKNGGSSALCRTLTLSIVYSVFGNYVGTLILMVLECAFLSILIPLILLISSLIVSVRENLAKRASPVPTENSAESKSLWRTMRPCFGSTLVLLILGLFLFIRFMIFSDLVVQWSDGMEYSHIIYDIRANDFLFNPLHSRWAPAYPILGFLVSTFNITHIESLKAVSFFFSIASLFPMLATFDSISSQAKEKRKTVKIALILFWSYPWMNVLSSTNLQDTTLTFFVISFVSLILSDSPIHKAISGLAAGLAFLLRYSLGLLGPIGLLFLIAMKPRLRRSWISSYLSLWSALVITWITRNLLVAGVLLSRSDETLIDPSNISANLNLVTQSQSVLLLNLFGIFPLLVSLPLLTTLIVRLRESDNKTAILKSMFTGKLLLIYVICILQLIVIFMFESPQTRFLLSIAWAIPVIWLYYNDYLESVRLDVLAFGWIFWSFTQTIYYLRTYWYLNFTRLPIHSSLEDYIIVQSNPLSAASWVMAGICIILLTVTPVILRKVEQWHNNEANH